MEPTFSIVDKLRLQGFDPCNIMLFGTGAFNNKARDQDYMVFDDSNNQQKTMDRMGRINLVYKCLKSTEFGGERKTVELYNGIVNNQSTDVCVVSDLALWLKWSCNATRPHGGINVVSRDVQVESYYHMAKSTESTPIESIKAIVGIVIMALMFVEQTQFYKMCLGMVDHICETRQEMWKFKMALQNNMEFTAQLAKKQVTLTSDVNQHKLLLNDCKSQLEHVSLQNTSLKSEVTSLRKTLSDLHTRMDTTNRRLEEVETLKSRVSELERINKGLKSKLSNEDDNLATVQSTALNVEVENTKLRKALDEKIQTINKLSEESSSLNTQLTGLRGINKQYELALKHPSNIRDTIIRQFIADAVSIYEFETPIGLDGDRLKLPSTLGDYFQLAFMSQSTDNIMVFSCSRAGFGFAFNMDRSCPCCQMIMVLDIDHSLHVCLSEEIPVVKGMFMKPIEPLKKIAQLATSHPLHSYSYSETNSITTEAVMGMPKVLSIIFQRLCRLNENSMKLATTLLRVDDSLF
jgi:hypothetical protein